MTKEELKQEAEEWVHNNNYPYSNCPNIEKKLKQAYLAGAEPREKHIAELEKEAEEYINKLTKQDIINYLSHECVTASDEEIDMIYNAIKNDYEEILNTNFMSYISNYKLNFNPELYKKIIEKYNEYKKFIE